MRRLLLLLLVLVLTVLFGLETLERITSPGPAGDKTVTKPGVIREQPKAPARTGEKIVYDITLGGLRLGKAVLHNQSRIQLDGSPADLITFDTKVVRFKDLERIYSDPGTSLPLKVEREIFAWPKYEKITEVYDQQKFTLNILKTSGGKTQEMSFKKNSVIHNAILLPYLVRDIPEIKTGWSFPANLPTQQFRIQMKGLEEIRVPAGSFKAYHFTSSPDKFEIWISADEAKIPLKIKGVSGPGYVLTMREYTPPTQTPIQNIEK